MDTLKLAYRDDDRTPVIYCIKEMAAAHYGVDVQVLRIKDYREFESAIFSGTADVLIDHVEFLYAEAARGKKITFFCAPKIVRGLELVAPKEIASPMEFAGKTMAVRASGRPHAVTLWLRAVGLEGRVKTVIVSDDEVGRWKQWKKVVSGDCIACFMDPLYLADALAAGLKVLSVPDTPVVGHYAQACTSEFAGASDKLLQNYLRAVIHALCLMKYNLPEALRIAAGEPMKLMKVESTAAMERYFRLIIATLQVKPYPTLEALRNTYEIAVQEYGAGGINPLALWDLHWVKQLDDSGFVDGLISDMSAAKS